MNRKREESDREPWEGRDRSSMPPLGFLIFGFIGATAVVARLRRTIRWFYSQQARNSESNWSNGSGPHKSEAWIRYKRRIQEMDEDERERVERIRRMQNVFNRERNKFKGNQETWTGTGTGSGSYQHSPRNDWYYKADEHYSKKDTNYRFTPDRTVNSHHYSVLGLDRCRSEPYTDDEIKSAFRKKALEFHPDQNKDNTHAAEAKFKEVMVSYEAIKSERKNKTC